MCALYSSVNGLRLALADHSPLTQAQCRELFADGVDFLRRKGSLDTALTTGTGKKRWHALTRFLAKRLSRSSVQLQVELPEHEAWPTIEYAFAWIDESLADEKPVLIALMGSLRHFTVVSASTPTTLQLFDSTGLRFVRKSSCGFSGTHHIVPPAGLLRIAVQVRT
jgi:hypothetical protein